MKKNAMKRLATAGVGIVAALSLAACSAPTQGAGSGGDAGEDVKAPATVKLITPFSAGGGTDVWARFVAPYMQDDIEGSPNLVVENREGGGGITGANKFARDNKTDGSEMLVSSGSIYLPQLLNQVEVEYDFTKMVPILLNGTGGVIYTSPDTGIESASDLAEFDGELHYGGISATGNDLIVLLAFAALDVDLKATMGFEGRGPARLAFERGEINVDYQTSSAYNSQVEPAVEEGTAVPLISFGVMEDGEVVRDPRYPDIPTLEEVYEEIHGEEPSGVAYEAYLAALTAGQFYQKGMWVSADTPESLVEAYRAAAAALVEDEEFNEEAADVLGGYPIIPGDEAQDALIAAFDIDDDVRQYMLDLLADEYDTQVDTK